MDVDLKTIIPVYFRVHRLRPVLTEICTYCLWSSVICCDQQTRRVQKALEMHVPKMVARVRLRRFNARSPSFLSSAASSAAEGLRGCSLYITIIGVKWRT